MKFADMNLHEATLSALEAMGFEEATPIQAETIPALMEGRDVIGQAKTGTGKTAAFGVPLVEAARNGKRGLVLAPTRELAMQVQQELQSIGKGSPFDVVCLIGGAPFNVQARAIQRHPKATIVATPGRIVDHLGRGTISLDDVSMFVLDEADEMLSMGFADELDKIVDAIPKERQSVMFTATLPPHVEKLAKKTLHDPATIRMGAGAAPDVRQGYCVVAGRDRVQAVQTIIEAEGPRATLLFCKTRARVEEIVNILPGSEALHGGMGQPIRDAVMRRFRSGDNKLLVATDVAARGLDVDDIDLVLHDEPAMDVDTYIHRIGRTGRAGRSGTSVLFIGPGKTKKLGPIRKAAGRLEEYTLPGEEELAVMRATRQLDELKEQVPSEASKALYHAAIESGMNPEEIALRALESMGTIAPPPEVIVEKPTALCIKVGTMDKVHAGAILGVMTNVGGLRADQVGRIDILEKMSVVEVPAEAMEQLCDTLGRARLSGRPLMPRPADDWRFKAAPTKKW